MQKSECKITSNDMNCAMYAFYDVGNYRDPENLTFKAKEIIRVEPQNSEAHLLVVICWCAMLMRNIDLGYVIKYLPSRESYLAVRRFGSEKENVFLDKIEDCLKIRYELLRETYDEFRKIKRNRARNSEFRKKIENEWINRIIAKYGVLLD